MRTALRMSETQKSNRMTGQVKAVCWPWSKAKRMLVKTAEKTKAGVEILLLECQSSRAAGGAGKREPVVGDGEGGQEEAAEEDLFEERSEEDAEEGDEPDVGWGAEEVVHGDVFGDGDEGRDGLHGEGEGEADGDETEGVASGGVGVRVDAVGEGPLPEQGKDEPGDGEGREVGERLGGDEEFGGDGGERMLVPPMAGA